MDYKQAFLILVNPQHEGGFTLDPKDPGNWTGGKPGVGVLKGTKFGISARSYPGEDIANLTLDRAEEFYRRDFWGPACCDAVPDLMKYPLFDFAVNTSAPGRCTNAIRVLQKAIGAHPDGVVGPQTLLMLSSIEPNRLFRKFAGAAIRYYTGVDKPLRDEYLAGWMNRLATNLEMA